MSALIDKPMNDDDVIKQLIDDNIEELIDQELLTIPFGKYKGKNIEEIIEEDPKYCIWMKNKLFTPESIKDYLNKHLKKEDEFILSDSITMNWGRHSGKNLRQIFKNDRYYINYLKSNKFVINNCKNIIEEIEKLEKEEEDLKEEIRELKNCKKK